MSGGSIQLQPLNPPVNIAQTGIFQQSPLSTGRTPSPAGSTTQLGSNVAESPEGKFHIPSADSIGVNLRTGNQCYPERPCQTLAAQQNRKRTPSPFGKVPAHTLLNRTNTNHGNASGLGRTVQSVDGSSLVQTLNNGANLHQRVASATSAGNNQSTIIKPSDSSLFVIPPSLNVSETQGATQNITFQADSVISASTANISLSGSQGALFDDKGNSVLQSLSEEYKPMDARKTTSSSQPTTVMTSLYANPFLSGQTSDVKLSGIDDIGASVRNRQPSKDADFELKFDDGGPTTLTPQTESQKTDNTNHVKQSSLTSSPQGDMPDFIPFSLFGDEGDLQIDLDRLDELTSELNKFGSVSPNVEPSKELELIQQEQKGKPTHVDLQSAISETQSDGKSAEYIRPSKELELIQQEGKRHNLKHERKLSQNADHANTATEDFEFDFILKSLKKASETEQNRNRTNEIPTSNPGNVEKDSSTELKIKGEQNTSSIEPKGWNRLLTLVSIEERNERIQILKKDGRMGEDVDIEIPSIRYNEVLAVRIIERLILCQIRNLLLIEYPTLQADKLKTTDDLYNRSEILAIKDLTCKVKDIVTDFEAEMSSWGLQYGDPIYLETLKLTTHFKTTVIDNLSRIQKEDRGLEGKLLLIMMRESLESLKPSYANRLSDLRESLESLLPEPGVAVAVEETVTSFEQKYIDSVFKTEFSRNAACALVYRIRKLLSLQLYGLEPMNCYAKDFQLRYSLKKLIFMQLSQFLVKLFPRLNCHVKDIGSLRKLCSKRTDIREAILYCLEKYSGDRDGLIFHAMREVLHSIKDNSAIDEGASDSQIDTQACYYVFVSTMSTLLEGMKVHGGKYRLFETQARQPPVIRSMTPTSDQTVQHKTSEKRPTENGNLPRVQNVTAPVVKSHVKQVSPVWTAAFEETASRNQRPVVDSLQDDSAAASTAQQKSQHIDILLDESNLTYYRTTTKEMKKDLSSSKPEVQSLISENKILMFSGLLESFMHKPTGWISSESEASSEEEEEKSCENTTGTNKNDISNQGATGHPTTESNLLGSVRVKEEPEDQGLYGVNHVTPVISQSEMVHKIKSEPGLEPTIKQEKDTEWSTSSVAATVKSEPVENEPCHQCPLHLQSSENVETATREPPTSCILHPGQTEERLSELGNVKDSTQNISNYDGGCAESNADSKFTSVPVPYTTDSPTKSESLSSLPPKKVSDTCPSEENSITSAVAQNHPQPTTEVQGSANREEKIVYEGLENRNSLDLYDILSKTVETVYSEIHGAEENSSDLPQINIFPQTENVQSQDQLEDKSPEIVPLRHSVEGTRQEALGFLKELNSLQSAQSVEAPPQSIVPETCQDDMNIWENSLEVKAPKIRPSVELDMILSETVDRVYSEIGSETGSLTGTAITEESEADTNKTEKLDNNTNHFDGTHDETVIKTEKLEPDVHNILERESGACGVIPIVIEPEQDDEDSIETDKAQDRTQLVQEDVVQTNMNEDIEVDTGNTEVTLINIEPVNIDTSQDTNELEREQPKELENTYDTVEQKSENIQESTPNENDQQPLKTEERADPTQSNNVIQNLGSLTIEADNQQAALKNILKKEAREKRRRQRLEKKMEKIQELKSYYDEQLKIIQNAKLTDGNDQKEIEEQLQCLRENHELAGVLGLDFRDVFGCYACGFTASSQEQVMMHWMQTHIEDSLYVCPYCFLDLPTSHSVVAHILEWHPKLPVRVLLKASEIYQDRIELEFMLSKKTPVNDQCFVVKTRNECYSVDKREDGGRQYECRKCEYFCMEKDLMELHTKLVHTAGTKFKCDICELYYSSYRSVEVHVLRDHYGRDPSEHLPVTQTISSQAVVPLKRRNWEKINLVTTNNLEYCARFSNMTHQNLFIKTSDYWHVCTEDFDNIFLLCKLCMFTQKEETLMWNHVVNMHESPKEVICPKCNTFLKVTANERQNCLTVCRECRILLTLDVEQGKELSCIEDLYVCVNCCFRTKDSKVMQQHAMQLHLNLKPYMCKYCTMRNAVKHIVKRHIAEIHPGQPSKVITDQLQINKINTELVGSYKTYQVISYKDETNKWKETGLDKRKKSTRDLNNEPDREFSEGEDLSAVLAGCEVKQSRSPTPPLDSAEYQNGPAKKDIEDSNKNYSGLDHYRCQMCEFKTLDRGYILKHVKRHLKLAPYQCYYCQYQHLDRHVVTNHVKKKHQDQPCLVYTNEKTLRTLNDEARKQIIKVKGSGDRIQMPNTQGGPFQLLQSHLDGKGNMIGRFTLKNKPNKKRQRSEDAEQMLKLLVERLPSKKKPQHDGPSWEQRSTDEEEWSLNQDLDSGEDGARRSRAANAQGKKATQSRQRKKTSQGSRQRIEADAGDSDESWSMEDRRRKRNKRQAPRKRMRLSGRVRLSDEDSDWLEEFLSDTDSDTQVRKTRKGKTQQYQLSDHDFRSNYAFLLNDDKLLIDPVVKIYPYEMEGTSVTLKNELKRPSGPAISEPQKPVAEVNSGQLLGVVVKTEPTDDFVVTSTQGLVLPDTGTAHLVAPEIQKQNTPMNPLPVYTPPTSSEVEKTTTVEVFSGGKKTLVQAIVEFEDCNTAAISELVAPEVDNIAQALENEKKLISSEIKIKEEPLESNQLEGRTDDVAENTAAAGNSPGEEPVIKSEPNVSDVQSERRSRRIARKAKEKVKVEPEENTKQRASPARHRWTDDELRVYHSHLNSDPLLTKKTTVLIERLSA